MAHPTEKPEPTGTAQADADSSYLRDIKEVIGHERQYLKQRRDAVNGHCTKEESREKLPPVKEDLWGFAISGGGIRAATFALGVIQGLTKGYQGCLPKGIFRRFDYMSTVSGGGFIGSCLSSLLTIYPAKEGVSLKHDKDVEAKGKAGVDPDNSPFYGLKEPRDSPQKFDAFDVGQWQRLRVRDVLHHLRSSGNYLARESKMFGRDMQRFIGTFVFGPLYNIVLFALLLTAVTALIHSGLLFLDHPETVFHTIAPDTNRKAPAPPKANRTRPIRPDTGTKEPVVLDKLGAKAVYNQELRNASDRIDDTTSRLSPDFYTNHITLWYDSCLHPAFIYLLGPNRPAAPGKHAQLQFWCQDPLYGLIYLVVGAFAGLITLVYAIGLWWRGKRLMINISTQAPDSSVKAGQTAQDRSDNRTLGGLNILNIAMMILLPLIISLINPNMPAGALLQIPLAYALGGCILAFIVIGVTESFIDERFRLMRSHFSAIKGACIYNCIIAAGIPLLTILGLSMSYFTITNLLWFVAFGFGAGLVQKKLQLNSQPSSVGTLFLRYYRPLLNIIVVIALLLLFADISRMTAWLYESIAPFYLALAAAGLAVAMSTLLNFNRLSPHYFYRDRLAEAYLKTDIRVARSTGDDRQGLPMVTLRNDEGMALHDLGRFNGPGDAGLPEEIGPAPYHLINASLNLQGSDETIRKDSGAEHFLFSKYYVGSRPTGYRKTTMYHRGNLKLAQAMTVSGAAFASQMGIYSFAAQRFFTTILNLRLGLWMENPWYYTRNQKRTESRFVFWLQYLWRELRGNTRGDTALINVSDGGHTGDNLGLLPLLQRRCKVIVVCDAEGDADYDFPGFNAALRLAYVEEHIDISIDLRPLQEREKKNGMSLSSRSVATGIIHYPEEDATGLLVYIKASPSNWKPKSFGKKAGSKQTDDKDEKSDDKDYWVRTLEEFLKSQPKEHDPAATGADGCFGEDWDMPAHVENYNRKNKAFPHQSIGDQFYDTEQFEAYRALGKHVAHQALPVLHALWRAEPPAAQAAAPAHNSPPQSGP